MKMNKELKISIPGKLPSASLLLLLSFSLTLLLLCPKPKSTKKKISSALSDVSSLYPLIPSSSFSVGFFSLFSTNLTSPRKNAPSLLVFPFQQRIPLNFLCDPNESKKNENLLCSQFSPNLLPRNLMQGNNPTTSQKSLFSPLLSLKPTNSSITLFPPTLLPLSPKVHLNGIN